MHINKTQFTPGKAAKLVLYADPYYTVLPTAGTANIIAVIKDINGNTKIDWNGDDIQFSITSDSDFPKSGGGSFLGYFVDDPGDTTGIDIKYKTPEGGIIFKASEYKIDDKLQKGDVVIEAYVELPNGGGTISDIITIDVTLDVVRIELSANPISIDADGLSISAIDADLKDSGDTTVAAATNDITFNISGEGIFVDSEGLSLPNTIIITPSGGIASIFVKSINDLPGVAIVTASSEGLLSDTINIITKGDPYSISVSVIPNLIYTNDLDGATVIVTIKDINGNPVKYTGTINLSKSTSTGAFGQDTDCDPLIPSDSLCFDNAIGDGLISGNTDIEVESALIADNISVAANPQNILAGGEVASEITATIRQGTTLISTYNNNIIFEMISDTSVLHDAVLSYDSITSTIIDLTGNDYGNDGEAMVHLKPASNVGTAIIKVFTHNSLGDYIEETIEVGFYSNAHRILLSAEPPKMEVSGGEPDTSIITARIVDESGTKVENYNEDITFTILEGWPSNAKFTLTNTSSLVQTVINGEISIGLTSQNKAGTVNLKASSFNGTENILGYLNIPVGIDLDLAVPPSINYDTSEPYYYVSFNIDVQGGELLLEEMLVSWDFLADETLNKIEIDSSVIYPETSTPISSGEPIDVIDSTLSITGTHNVKLYFNANMSGKSTLDVTFNPNSGDYLLHLKP